MSWLKLAFLAVLLFAAAVPTQSWALGLGWSTDADWTTGNFSNATTVDGVLQVNKSLYREYEIENGTVSWWHFNENSGSAAADSSGNENAGTLGNASAWTAPAWVTGRFGNALLFNAGKGQFVNISGPSRSLATITNNVTAEAWVNLNETQPSFIGSDSYSAVLMRDGSFYLRGYSNATGGETAGFWVYAGGAWFGATSNTDLRGTGWRHLAGTYDGSAVRFYIDGLLKMTTPATGMIGPSSQNISIGSTNGTLEFFNGTIDEVRIINRTLSPDEMVLDYAGYFRSARYVSNTTVLNGTILSVHALMNKTEYNWNGIDRNTVNLTVEVSVNNGTTWRLADNNATLNTSADNGASFSFRVNFATNDTRLRASLSSIIFTIATADSTGPRVTLNSPQSGYSQTGSVDVLFNCSATSSAGLYSIALWHNMTGTWKENQTVLVTGLSNGTSFRLNATSGSFAWNCRAADSFGNNVFGAGNYTISIIQSPPSLSLAFYPSAGVSVQQGGNGTVTATVTNTGGSQARNVSLSFSSVACCSFSASPTGTDINQQGSANFTIGISVLAGSSAAAFSTVVTARTQDSISASSPLTVNVQAAPAPTPTQTRTPPPFTPSPTPDVKKLAEEAIAQANSTILSVDIQIAVAERERKDVRLAVSRLAEARGLLKRAYSLAYGEVKDYEGAQKAALDAMSRARDALDAIPEKGKSRMTDILIILAIVVLVAVMGFIVYSTFFAPKKRQPIQQPYQYYYRNYPYYQYPPQGWQQQQPGRRP